MKHDYAEFATRAAIATLTRETAGNASRLLGGLFNSLPNPDPVLRKTGQSITVLDEIRREAHVAACAESREAAVTKKLWEIRRNDATPKAAETIESVFKELSIRRVVREMCEAWGYGYQISEIIWKRSGDLLLPERVYGLPRPWFTFGRDGALRLLSSPGDITGTPVEERKYLLTQHRASYENPYGESKYTACFWPVTFKKGGLKFWAVFLEKFGMPHAVGKLPRSSGDKERNELLQSLSSMVRDACAVFPDDSSVELITSNASASSDAYERFAAYNDGEISTSILGHNAGATSTPGRLGGDQLALQVRADIVENDAGMVADTLNTLIQYIHELNPSLGVARPGFALYDEKDDIDKPRAERDALLLNTRAVVFSKKYYCDKYGFEEDEIEVVEQGGGVAEGAEFAGAAAAPAKGKADDGQEAIDALADGLDEGMLERQSAELMKPFFELVENAKSFEDVVKGIDGLEIDSSGVQETAEKIILLGEVWGKLGKTKGGQRG